MIWMIVYYVLYAMELFLVGEGIFHNRVRKSVRYAAAAAVYLLVMIPAVLFIKQSGFLIMALNLCMFLFLFQGSVASRFLHFGVVYLLINLAESLLFGIGNLLYLSSVKCVGVVFNGLGESSLLFAAVVTVLLLSIIRRKAAQRFFVYVRALNRFQYLLIVLIVWSGILLLGMVTAMTKSMGNQGESITLFCFTAVFMGTAFVSVILFVCNGYRKDYYRRLGQIKEEIIQEQKAFCQKAEDNDREMRRFRHDISSQLGCLGMFLAEGKTQEAVKHLQAIGNHFERLAIRKYHTGNETLDLIINQKKLEAGKKGIAIEAEGKLDQPDVMDSYDLCAIFSNMLDNGIEACEKIRVQDAKIQISILTHGNAVFFRFMNPAAPEMYEALKRGGTTKDNKKAHGFGMENVRLALDRYGGEITCLYKEGKLTVELYFER